MADRLVIKKRGDDGYKTFSIRIKNETVDKIDKIASETNMSRNQIIQEMLDFASDKLISCYSNDLYFVGANSPKSLSKCNKSGETFAQYGLTSSGESLVSDSVFLVSKLDGSIYIAGHGSNLVTTKSARDWQILKF